MSDVQPQPAQQPVTPAPSAVPLNAASLVRLLMALIAGIIIQHTGANPQDAQTYAGLILLVGAAVWNYFKNRNVVNNIIGSLQAPAQRVVNPATGNTIPPVIQTVVLVAIICLSGLHLAGCAQGAVAPPTAQVAIAQGDAALDDVYNKTASYYLAHVPADPARKARVKDDFAKAYEIVQAVDAAELLGRADTMAAQIAAAFSLINDARQVLGLAPATAGATP